MRADLNALAVALAVAVVIASGCRTTSPSARTPGERKASAREQAALERADEAREAAVEQRVKVFANFATGLSRELNEAPDEALPFYYEAAVADPTQEEMVLEVSRRLLQRQETDKAVALLEKASARPTASGALFVHLGLAYAQGSKTEQAIGAYRSALKKSPRLLAGYQNLAQLHVQQKQFKEALHVLDEASKLPDLDAGFLVDLAEVYASLTRQKVPEAEAAKPRAIDALDRASQLKPESPFVLQKLADGYKLLGELPKAPAIYLQLLERFPKQAGLREKLTDIYLRSGDKQKASEQLEAITRDYPTNPNAYYFLGGIAAEEKQYAKAADHFKRAMLLNPDFEQVYYDLAGLQITLEQPNEALATLEKAAGKFKDNFVASFYRGMAHSVLKKYSDAIKHLIAAEIWAKANEPQRLTQIFYFQMGAAYERGGQHADAEQAFRKCLELAPNFPDALNYLGYMWAERGVNLSEARTMIAKAVELEPKNAAYLDSLGWVLFKLDQPQEALKHLLEAVKHSEKPDATIYDHLGDVYTSLKQYEQAREAWRKSLETEPSELIRKKIEASPREDRSAK